ncbi:MAG: HAMP domain-containing histidine kinase, partial [Anaerolineae bacterium]|nr:HAMP domain-containing histidine kinase [Anaerolineae bacterium]
VLASPITMPSGGTVGRVTVFRNVTALVQAERLKDELVMQMSHELRTPLTVLRGNIELLRILETRNLSQKGISFLNKTVEHMGTLERLINQVVDVSSIQAGRYDMHRCSLDLNEVLKERIEAWRPEMESRELQFDTEIPEQPLPLHGDPSRLSEVLDHVLRNAYSYTLPGGVVNLRAGRENGHVSIVVQDSGVGIQTNEMERVFDRLYRGTAADAGPTDSRGLGLGLYLSKHIVEQHEGTIRLNSLPEKGTIVRVELPAAKSAR